MEITIRKMKQTDLKILFNLGIKQWGKEENWLTKSYLDNSFNQKGLSFIAEKEGKVIGGIIMVFEDIVKNWIRYLIVDKEERRSGIGKRLIEELISSLNEGESIFVDTGIADKGALYFYEKMGFKNRGKVKSLYEHSAGYILEKNIH